MLSKSFIIKIPKKSTIWIKFLKETSVTVLTYRSQSVIATPKYSASTVDWKYTNDNFKFMTYVVGNFLVKFTVKDCKLPEGFKFHFLADNEKI